MGAIGTPLFWRQTRWPTALAIAPHVDALQREDELRG